MKSFNKEDIKSGIDKVTSTRKFKYGSFATAFTVIFLVFVIAVNALISFVSDKVGGIYLDMTSESIYGITDATRDALKDVSGEVEIIFAAERDIIESSQYADPIKRLCENYQSEFSNVKVLFENVVSNPTYFNKFKQTSEDDINSNSVIVHSPKTGRSVLLNINSFYKYSSSGRVFAFDGENQITTSILQTARPQDLLCGFTTGHGESVSQSLMFLLAEQGYKVTTVDLKTVDKNALSKFNLLVICDPKNDFTGLNEEKEGYVNEIALLKNYYKENFGNLMIYLSPETPELSELKQFMNDECGVTYTPGTILRDTNTNTVSSDGYAILGSFSGKEGTAGYAIGKTLSTNVSSAKPLLDYSTPLKIVFEKGENINVSPAISASKGAQSITGGHAQNSPLSPIMTISDYAKMTGGEEKHAYALVCGSTYFLSYLPTNQSNTVITGSSQYGNYNVVKNALSLMGNMNIAANIDFKVLDEADISVSEKQKENITLRLGLFVPVIICIAGAVVFVKRKFL